MLLLPLDAVVLESEVLAVDGERERGGSGSVAASMAPAVTECDLRRDEEEGCVWVESGTLSSVCF